LEPTENYAAMSAVEKEIGALGGLPTQELKIAWRRLHRTPPPRCMPRDLITGAHWSGPRFKENGERRIITKLQAALKQLANKAASGDAAAIREVLRVQAAIAEIVPAGDQHDHTGKHGERPNPAETDPRKLALALLTLFHAPDPGRK
jgi:hypothetical protein